MLRVAHPVHGAHAPTPIYCRPFFTLDPAPRLTRNIALRTPHFRMSDEQQQNMDEYSYHPVTNTAPSAPHNQAAMPRDCAIHPAPEMSQDDIFAPPPAAAHPAYCEQHRAGYAQYYVPIPPNDGATHVHHQTPRAPQSTIRLNNIAPAQPCGSGTATADRPPFFHVPFGENTPVPSERPTKRTRGHAMWFLNNPRSNIIKFHVESSMGRSRVIIELEIDDEA
ncbi:hypothetical protein DFH94DRAFT_712986 [Russula ochroleuca]|uniref:Uncharacterized protein n=1 Tax=Russula ochroleuca TaxID=152965 RepID=A0A9P5N4Q6_9AGAM|nr:hypothetical protein DFH94DRAFT_712986 [Russula ochroleuca]